MNYIQGILKDRKLKEQQKLQTRHNNLYQNNQTYQQIYDEIDKISNNTLINDNIKNTLQKIKKKILLPSEEQILNLWSFVFGKNGTQCIVSNIALLPTDKDKTDIQNSLDTYLKKSLKDIVTALPLINRLCITVKEKTNTDKLSTLKNTLSVNPQGKTIPTDTECPLCISEFTDPVYTKCNHKFCKECIEDYIDNGGTTCPVCRQDLISAKSLNFGANKNRRSFKKHKPKTRKPRRSLKKRKSNTSKPKLSMKDFYNKYKNAENVTLGGLFNIYLIYNGGRLAYLSEIGDEGELETFKSLFPDLQYTSDSTGRTFIHIHPLSVENIDNDEYVAKILGFDCLGIPDSSQISYVISYFIDDDNFLTYICDDKNKIKNKTKFFQKFAGSGFKISSIISTKLPDDLIPNAILNDDRDFLNKHRTDFYNFLYNNNAGLFIDNYLEENVGRDVLDIMDICRNWLVFFALKELNFDPIQIFIPLSAEENEKYTYEIFNLMCKHEPKCIESYKFLDISENDPDVVEYNKKCKKIMKIYKEYKKNNT